MFVTRGLSYSVSKYETKFSNIFRNKFIKSLLPLQKVYNWLTNRCNRKGKLSVRVHINTYHFLFYIHIYTNIYCIWSAYHMITRKNNISPQTWNPLKSNSIVILLYGNNLFNNISYKLNNTRICFILKSDFPSVQTDLIKTLLGLAQKD